jgi:predicted lysophospholipase L1 biosynthesis ABC-type transport system permease subunit
MRQEERETDLSITSFLLGAVAGIGLCGLVYILVKSAMIALIIMAALIVVIWVFSKI